MLQILIALLAGVLTIAAPCILPLLPILLGASVGNRSKTRPFFIVLGFILVFSLASLFLSTLVQKFGFNANVLRNIAVVALGIFGLFLVWPNLYERFISRFSSLFTGAERMGVKAGEGNFGGFVLGSILGIIWTPCAGPVLAAILTLIITQSDFVRSAILLLAYSVGAGIPMLVIAYGGQGIIGKVRFLAQYSVRIQQVFGVIIIALAIAMYFQYDLILQVKLLEFYNFSGLEKKFLPEL